MFASVLAVTLTCQNQPLPVQLMLFILKTINNYPPRQRGFFLSPASPNPSRAALHNIVIQRIAHSIPIVVVFVHDFS